MESTNFFFRTINYSPDNDQLRSHRTRFVCLVIEIEFYLRMNDTFAVQVFFNVLIVRNDFVVDLDIAF